MTRIIAGSAGGRRLSVPPAGTRPTSDRVREALFSALDSEWRAREVRWPDVAVLDLYAGSGALGLEALSRGASQAVLVERSRAAAAILRANVAAVDLPGAVVIVRDVGQLPLSPPPGDPATLVLADPPYDVPAGDVARNLAVLQDAGWIGDDAVVVIERPARDALSPLPDSWIEDRRRAYGDTVLWYGRSAANGGSVAEGR